MITKRRSGDYLSRAFSFTVHHANIQTVLLEMYKIKNNLSKCCLRNLFSALHGNCSLGSQSDFKNSWYKNIFLR